MNQPSSQAIRRFLSIYATSAKAHREIQKLIRSGHTPSSPEIQSIQMRWAKDAVGLVGGQLTVRGETPLQDPCLVVANHMGYVDIPVLMALYPFAYVAKKAVSHWPVFGAGAASVGTVFVDRSSTQSRHEVALAIGDSIKNRKKGVILFPEGTSSVRGKAWKKGAFHIANKMGLRVQPVRIVYTPARKIAYVERDVFVPHLLRLLKLGSFEVDVEVGPVTQILDVEADRSRLEAWVQGGVREALERQGVRD